jgi:hypothetical protein
MKIFTLGHAPLSATKGHNLEIGLCLWYAAKVRHFITVWFQSANVSKNRSFGFNCNVLYEKTVNICFLFTLKGSQLDNMRIAHQLMLLFLV